MADQTYDAKTLNSMLETVIDSIDGFEQANALVDTASFKPIFAAVVSERRKLAGEIETHIRAAGGTPDDGHHARVRASRADEAARCRLEGRHRGGRRGRARRGSHQGRCEKAAKDGDLTPNVAQFMTAASARVTAGHNLIRDLKHSLHAAKG